jgi:hypothetical protein
MTDKVSDNRWQDIIPGSLFLAAALILSLSPGVTPLQAGVEVSAADRNSTHDFGTRLAETKAIHIENSQVKTNPPVSKGVTFNPTPANPLVKTNPPVSQQPVSKGFVYGGSKSKSAPQEQPKR